VKYLYTGPVSGATMNTPSGPLEIMLFPGKEVDLPDYPECRPYINVLVARGHLRTAQPAPESTAEAEEAAEAQKPSKGSKS
jgi:hypothetical protein